MRMSADAHANSIRRIFPRLGESGTAQQIIDRLDENPGVRILPA